MAQLVAIFFSVVAFALGTMAQSIPAELLEVPVKLAVDKPMVEAKAGSTVTYTITLKNARNQTVAAPAALQIEIKTPTGRETVSLPTHQSSVTFSWQTVNSGVARISAQAGKLRPATALVLVLPSPKALIPVVPPKQEPVHAAAAPPMMHAFKKSPPKHPGAAGAAKIAVAPLAPHLVAAPPPPPAAVSATKITLYVAPLTIFGDAVDHVWTAHVSVAAMAAQDALAPVSTNVTIRLRSGTGRLSSQDINLAPGQISDFQNPVLLTADHPGSDTIAADSTLGPAKPVDVEYLEPLPTKLRLSISTPALTGGGSSTADVQICLLDDSGGVTSSSKDTEVTLTPSTGEVNSREVMIRRNVSCSDATLWTSVPGEANLQAESTGLKSDSKNIRFPAFPWYFVWLAALGGLLGALVSSKGQLFSSRWWSHTWRGLVLGALLGAVFYLFARFGAIKLPADSPINIQNIPVWSGVGSFLLGFFGGLYGRKLWRTA